MTVAGVEADLAAEVRRDLAVVAGDDLDRDPEPGEAGERLLRRRPWPDR